ncbi:hypothetical protein EG028_04635 [Chitinophaga barathri]|uniref:Uncharacterized protein n=2 Tax=Chitinophaga barathri TaxID=1647451 RepID=A0A3N4MK66_9BACT|nr:hypothetical protein EG028_04635 [Chitinophaga barathri]
MTVSLAAAAGMPEDRIVKGAVSRIGAVIRQNQLNDATGQSGNNQYIIYLDVAELMAPQTELPFAVPFLHQGKGRGEELYVASDQVPVLEKKLADIKKTTGIAPYLVIIHNVPLMLQNKLGPNEKLEAVFKSQRKTNGSPGQLAEENSTVIGQKIRNGLGGVLKDAILFNWIRYIGVYLDEPQSGYYEVYNSTSYDVSKTAQDLVGEGILTVNGRTRPERANMFVDAISNGLTTYALAKPPTSGPGKEFYDKYYSVADDEKMLAIIANKINEMGQTLYDQYVKDAKDESNGWSNEDFKSFYNSLKAYEASYKKWLDLVGTEVDPERILLKYRYTPQPSGWFANLPVATRIKALKVINKGNLADIDNLFASAFEMEGYGGEQFALELISNTPDKDQDSLLKELGRESLLQTLVSKIDGDEFGQFVENIARFIENQYPPEKYAFTDLLARRHYIQFHGGFWGPANSKDFDDDGKVVLKVRKNFHFNYQSNFKVSPYDYVVVDFKKDFSIGGGKFLAGDRYKLPAIYCYYLFNEGNNKKIMTFTKGAINIALFAVGVGELKAAIEAGKAARIIIAAIDIGAFGADLVINEAFGEYLSEHHPNFLTAWNALNISYGVTRLAFELPGIARNVIKWGDAALADVKLTFSQKATLERIIAKAKEIANVPKKIRKLFEPSEWKLFEQRLSTLNLSHVRQLPRNIQALMGEFSDDLLRLLEADLQASASFKGLVEGNEQVLLAWKVLSVTPFRTGPKYLHYVANLADDVKLGAATIADYRATFFKEFTELVKEDYVVHHAIEQQVLKNFPTLFTSAEINSLENLRGIPKTVNSDLHLSRIRIQWNRFIENTPNPTRAQFMEKAKEIDDLYGNEFFPPIR